MAIVQDWSMGPETLPADVSVISTLTESGAPVEASVMAVHVAGANTMRPGLEGPKNPL